MMSSFFSHPVTKGVAILMVGVVGLALFIVTRPDPPKEAPEAFAPAVEVERVRLEAGPLRVEATGSVRARREVNLSSEVAGRIVAVSPSFVDGGAFKKGDVLVRLDSTDYVNAVTSARAQVTQRRFDVIVAREEVAAARDEFRRMQDRLSGSLEQTEVARAAAQAERARAAAEPLTPDTTDLGSLLFREPQLRLAEAALAAARAALRDAETRLERTRIRAPFDGRVRAKMVDIGTYATPGMVLAQVFGTDIAEITVPLTQRQAALIPALGGSPAAATAAAGTAAERPSVQITDNQGRTWQGVLDRSAGAVSSESRTLTAIVRVDRPYEQSPPLRVGTFVNVSIAAQELGPHVRLGEASVRNADPTDAQREGDSKYTVWVLEGDRLRMRPVDVTTIENGMAIITGGLADGDAVITTGLLVVSDSMQVRLAGDDAASAQGAEQ